MKFSSKIIIAGKCSIFATAVVVAAALPQVGFTAGGGAELEHFTPVRTDRALQRGARTYMNYCQGCHTADYQRYSRLAEDIGLSDEDML